MIGKILNGHLEITLDLNVYSKEAIFKCAYWYLSDYFTEVVSVENNLFKVTFTPKNKELSSLISEDKLNDIKNSFIDFNLRDIVSKETQNIRDLLTAKAFSNGEFDEQPPGDYSDPVGFKI
jgi:His-Xaa-Ser system protein HxsD